MRGVAAPGDWVVVLVKVFVVPAGPVRVQPVIMVLSLEAWMAGSPSIKPNDLARLRIFERPMACCSRCRMARLIPASGQ